MNIDIFAAIYYTVWMLCVQGINFGYKGNWK